MARSTHSLAGQKRQFARLALLLALSVCLLWVASPLLFGQTSLSRKPTYERMQKLRLQLLCRRHLQMLNLGFTQYAADYNGRLPALDNPKKLRKQLQAYKVTGGNLVCPISNQDFHINKRLAGKKLEDIPEENRLKTLILWSPRPMADGYYMVMDGTGQGRRVSAGELSSMKSFSRVQ